MLLRYLTPQEFKVFPKLAQLLKHPEDNMYTIEKPGVKKILYQTPWKENGEIKGLVEISFQLVGMPHFIRG